MSAAIPSSLVTKILGLFNVRTKRQQDIALWHKCSAPTVPQETVEGGWTDQHDQVWCRFRNGQWEYSQRPLSFDEWADRQW